MKSTIQTQEIELELYNIKTLTEFLTIWAESTGESLGAACILKEITSNIEAIFKTLEFKD